MPQLHICTDGVIVAVQHREAVSLVGHGFGCRFLSQLDLTGVLADC